MRHLLLLSTLYLSFFTHLQAQQTFTLTPNPVIGEYVDDYINEGRATIKNTTSNTHNFRWKRTIIRLDNDSTCYTAVTDPYLHWYHAVSEKNFTMDAGQEGPLYVTLYDFEQAGCCAIVQMKVKNLDVPTDSIEAYYYLRSCQPLAVLDLQKSSVQVFPNPVAQYFSLQNAKFVHRLTLCDASGKMLKRMQANTEHRYGISDLPLGTFYLVLGNKDGGILQVLQFQKASD